MKFIRINSHHHYQLQQCDKMIVLREYPDSACPAMGQRAPFSPEEGHEIARLRPGEFVQLDYGGPYLREDNISVANADGKIRCGDDLHYHIG